MILKAAIFFIAFRPQFIDPAASLPIWVQFLVLGTIANLAFSPADLICVLRATSIATRVRRSGLAGRLLRVWPLVDRAWRPFGVCP